MDRKFLIILFATVFYNGVTQSSPVGQQISDARLPEEKPPTVQPPTADHLNKKIETASVSTLKPSLPVSHEETPAPPHVEVPIVKIATNNSTSEAPHVVDGKNANDAEINKNIRVADNKTMNSTADSKNTTEHIDNKNSNQVPDSKNSSIPATDKNSSVTPIPTSSTGSSTTVVTTEPTTKASPGSTTTVKPQTTVTTLAPSTTSKDSVVAGQNTPAPPAPQEKNFDGASFVGGIVLTIGLTAIGFIAFKYYKSGKIDMHYRTL